METGCPVIAGEDKTSQGVIAAVAVPSQIAAAAIEQTNENETNTAVNVDVHNSTLQAVNSQKGDLLGIENLGRLSNLLTDDAIKFIASHIGPFHELVNQKSIKDRQLNVLIQVISNICSTSSNFHVQKHLIRIVTNQHFLKNILSYMRDSMAPRLDLVKYEAPRTVFYSTSKPYCTENLALSHLQTYFKFVEKNLKELVTTNDAFTEGFVFLEQLVSNNEEIEEKQSSCAISEDDLTSCSSRSSLCETPANVNVDEDPVGIDSLRNLLGKPHPEAIKFIDSHYIRFGSLLNQTSISNPHLIALITFIGVKLCVHKCFLPDLRDKLFLVIANVNFVKNILKYTKRNLLARRIESGPKLKSPSGFKANSRAVFAPKVVLKNLLKICRFVEDNLVDAAPTDFAECFNLLTQLERSYEDGKKDSQTSSANVSVGHHHHEQVERESAINDPSNTNSTENLLGIQVLSTLLTKDSDEVISTVHALLGELSKLVHKSITPSHLNVLLQILVSKICTFVTASASSRDQDVHVQQFQKEILRVVSDSKFLRKLRKHLNKIASSILKVPKGQSLTSNETNENPPEMTLNYTAVEVFESVSQYYYFLLVPKIQNEILLEFDFDLLGKNITSAREFLQQIKNKGEVGEFSDQNPQAFQILQLSWKKLDACLNQCTSKKTKKAKKVTKIEKIKKTKALSPAVTIGLETPSVSTGKYFPSASLSLSSSSITEIPDAIRTAQILSRAQKETKKPEQTTSIINIQSVNSTPHLFTVDLLIKMKLMPADQVFNLICMERVHFKHFITQNEIPWNQLNLLIFIIGSKLCSRTVFVHFQKYLFSMLLEESFLKKILSFTREISIHINRKRPFPPYCSRPEIFENLFKFYNLSLIYCCENPSAQLQKNIRSAGGLLLNVLRNKNTVMSMTPSTLATFQQHAELFKTLVVVNSTVERTKMMMEVEATLKEESNPIQHPYVNAPSSVDLTLFLVTPSEPVSVSDTDTVMDVVDSLITEIEVIELQITNYLGVPGFVKSVFFIDHNDALCENVEFRPDYIVALCRHVILQNYEASQVKVLVNDRDQALLLKNIFETLENPFCSVEVGPLSSYDGNESDVIILSLPGPNVNNVHRQLYNALYKVRHGCYILGSKNDLLKSNPKMWAHFLSKLEKDESIGDKLKLRCQIHRTDFSVRTPADFRSKSADGGCCRPCDMPLGNCEHRCQKFCHVVDRHHEDYKCQILIDTKLKCGHMGNVEC